jgi:hypothetical protein
MKKNLLYLAVTLLCVNLFILFLFVYNRRTDTTPPVIRFAEGQLELSARDPQRALLQGVSAQDQNDGDVTASVVIADVRMLDADGTIQVTYAAFDSAGNAARAVRMARYTDYESPRFQLNRSMTFAANTSFDLFREVKAVDMLDGDISHRVRIASMDEQSISTPGLHRVKLQVSNSLGETVELEIPVEVYAAGVYQAALTLTDYLVYLPTGTEVAAEKYLENFIVGNQTVSLEKGVPEGFTLDVQQNVQIHVPGVYTVEYRLTRTDETGNMDQTGYAKLIVVVEG